MFFTLRTHSILGIIFVIRLFPPYLCVRLFLCSLFSQLILPLFLEKDNVTFTIRHHWDSGKRAAYCHS